MQEDLSTSGSPSVKAWPWDRSQAVAADHLVCFRHNLFSKKKFIAIVGFPNLVHPRRSLESERLHLADSTVVAQDPCHRRLSHLETNRMRNIGIVDHNKICNQLDFLFPNPIFSARVHLCQLFRIQTSLLAACFVEIPELTFCHKF